MNDRRVAIVDGLLHFNGKAIVPFGGEVQYFRNRDPHGDPLRTHEIWRETLDRMASAGMNHVTTYVPWDWHEEDEGKFRWDGDRDLDRFLALAYARGFVVALKPGPFIVAEWPRGFGSCGAVPAWFRAKHPGALAKTPKGKPWSFDPLGGSDQTQPRYDSPEFLEATKRWFTALAPIVKRYVFERPCIAMLQLDNETNFWWSDLEHLDLPGGYDYRQDLIAWYLSRLKDLWEELGVSDNDVLFTANDSPFAIPGRRNILADGPRKNAVALLTLDTYPKGYPIGGAPADQPFQAPYFTRLFEHHSRRDFAYAAEIQAMDLKHLFGFSAKCDCRATGVLLTQLFGSGLKGGALYVMREGLSADGTLYGPAAPIAIHGDATSRWDTAAKFSRFLVKHGMELARSPHIARVAVATHRSHASEEEEKGRLWSNEGPGVFGWLRMAGYDPAVVDLDECTAADLEKFAAVVCVRPEVFPPSAREVLAATAESGATVVELACGDEPENWGPFLPGALDGLIFDWPQATAFCALPGVNGTINVKRERRRVVEEGNVFLRGPDGRPLGTILHNAWGRAIRVGARFTGDYNRSTFYDLDDAELRMRRDLARALVGVEPAIKVDAPRVEAWRRGPFVFLVNHGHATPVRIEGIPRLRDAITGELRNPRKVDMPELGWAIFREE